MARRPELLNRRNLLSAARRRSGTIAAWFVARLGNGVVQLSNVLAVAGEALNWMAIGRRRPADLAPLNGSHDVVLRIRFPVDNGALSALHVKAFGNPVTDRLQSQPWATRLERHSLSWVGAFHGKALIGFVHACWDGGVHAFLLDTVVAPDWQRQGIATGMVQALIAEVRAAGCSWLHVDYEPHLAGFYRDACGFAPTAAGLLRLNGDDPHVVS